MKLKTQYALAVFGFGLLLYFISSLNIQLSSVFLIKRPEYVLASIIMYLMFFPASGLRIKYLLNSIENKSTDIKSLIKIEFISKYVYFVTPSKLYLPAKAIMLGKKAGIKKTVGMAIVSFEYSMDTAITIMLTLWGAAYLFNGTFDMSLSNLVYILMAIIALIFIPISMPKKTMDILSERSERFKNKYIKDNTTIMLNIIKTTRSTWHYIIFNKKMQYIMPITLLQILLASISTKFLFLSMSADVSLYWIIMVNSASVLVGGISQIPGGIGIRESAAIFLYAALGIAKETAIIVVLITRIFTIIPAILGYWYSLNSNINGK